MNHIIIWTFQGRSEPVHQNKWEIDRFEAFRLFQVVKTYEISIQTVPGGNLVAVALLPSNEILETQVVTGMTFEDAQRAMRLANQLVKQITQKSH